MSVEKVTVECFVEKDSPVLVVPAGHWRILVWLHAELAYKYRNHWHVDWDSGSASSWPQLPK